MTKPLSSNNSSTVKDQLLSFADPFHLKIPSSLNRCLVFSSPPSPDLPGLNQEGIQEGNNCASDTVSSFLLVVCPEDTFNRVHISM